MAEKIVSSGKSIRINDGDEKSCSIRAIQSVIFSED